MKTFQEVLNTYIDEIGCSANELAKASGVSAAAISRYRAGLRVPESDQSTIKRLAIGITVLASPIGIVLTEKEVFDSLSNTLQNEKTYAQLHEKFDQLILTLKISLNDLAKALNFDASYLSRIRSGQRTPAHVENFVDIVCQYVNRHYNNPESISLIASMIGKDETSLNTDNLYVALSEWFCINVDSSDRQMESFLKKLNDFDLDEYIRAIHFDELKVPTVPFQLPASRNYYGIEQMKQGELDFFKSTVLSKSMDSIFMCSDMPMADMAKDENFGKKWMFAIAMSLKKGLHLNIIHNIDRPFHEMMLGLESWIPIYMTGQVSPYHLKDISTNYYHHINYVSGTVALSGECINSYHSDGKYYLTNNKEEVAYYRKKANNLLSKASPLMDIYTESDQNKLNEFTKKSVDLSGDRINTLSSLPLYTISRELLLSILERNQISTALKNQILTWADSIKSQCEKILECNTVTDTIPYLSREEFNKHPMALSLSALFLDQEIRYTYEEYLAHLEMTKEFSSLHSTYHCKESSNMPFRNIQIHVLDGEWVHISKNKAPTIHFVIHHPKMVYALLNFSAPVSEQ